MKLAILHYSAPPTIGGVELTMLHQARCLADAGYEPILVSGDGSGPGRVVIPEMSSRHTRVIDAKRELDAGRVPADFDALRRDLRISLGDALTGADAVIVHNVCVLNKNLALSLALRDLCEGELSGKRWIGWHHDLAWTMEQYGTELHAGWPWRSLRESWAGMVNVCVSESRRDAFAALCGVAPNTVRVIHPGIDETALLALTPTIGRVARAVEQADLLLLQPSRITRRKNIEFSLRTLGALRSTTGLDARLLVSGPLGPHNPTNESYWRSLSTLRDSLGLQGSALFLRMDALEGEPIADDLSDADVGALFRLCDMLYLPSTDEGFGMPILEAIAVGRAIVCSDLPPLRASAGETATYIDPRGAPEAAADTIASLVKRMPRILLRRSVLKQSSWRAVVRRDLLSLIEPRAEGKA